MDTSLIVFAAAIVGSALGAIVSNLMNGRLARQQRDEAKRLERLHYLNSRLELITEIRSKLQYLQGQNDAEREIAYGKAYALMLSTNDDEIAERAKAVMHGKFYPQQNRNEKLDAIDFALQRLGKLISQVME